MYVSGDTEWLTVTGMVRRTLAYLILVRAYID